MQQWHRRRGRRSALLAGALLGLATGTLPAAGAALGAEWVLVGSLAAVGTLGWAWVDGDARALRSMRARPVGEAEAPELHRLVAGLCAASGQARPRLYVSPVPAPNAFATGRSPRRAAICVTSGLLAVLDESQLRAVLAHELAHVRTRDTVVAGLLTAVSSAVLAAAALAWLLRGGHHEEPGSSGDGLLLLLLAPLAALPLHVGLRRRREHAADLSSALTTGDPLALASALRILDVGARAVPLPREPGLRCTGALMVTDPFARPGLSALVSSHPPIAERLARLERLAGPARPSS